MTRSLGRLTVTTYDDPDDLTSTGWDELVRMTGAPVFYESAYLKAYHEHPLGQIERFGYLVVTERKAELPAAVLPVALHTQADPLGNLRGVEPRIEGAPALLSHVWHCYDTQIVGAVHRPEVAAAMLAALQDLARQWGVRWIGLINVERHSATASALAATGLTARHLTDRFSADLTGLTDLDGYLRRLGVRPRANLTRCARRAAESGITTTAAPAAETNLEEVAELCGRTAARFGNADYYPVSAFAAFVTGLGKLAHVLAVRQRGRLVAAGVCLADERRFHTWACGVDYNVTGNASPYALLFAQSVALAIELGSVVIEGGRSNAVFKTRHGMSVRPLDAYLSRL